MKVILWISIGRPVILVACGHGFDVQQEAVVAAARFFTAAQCSPVENALGLPTRVSVNTLVIEQLGGLKKYESD